MMMPSVSVRLILAVVAASAVFGAAAGAPANRDADAFGSATKPLSKPGSWLTQSPPRSTNQGGDVSSNALQTTLIPREGMKELFAIHENRTARPPPRVRVGSEVLGAEHLPGLKADVDVVRSPLPSAHAFPNGLPSCFGESAHRFHLLHRLAACESRARARPSTPRIDCEPRTTRTAFSDAPLNHERLVQRRRRRGRHDQLLHEGSQPAHSPVLRLVLGARRALLPRRSGEDRTQGAVGRHQL